MQLTGEPAEIKLRGVARRKEPGYLFIFLFPLFLIANFSIRDECIMHMTMERKGVQEINIIVGMNILDTFVSPPLFFLSF